MFQVNTQSTALRLKIKNMNREALAFALGVSVRAVHRWLVEEENANHRAMAPSLLQEVLYWLDGAPGLVEFRIVRSLTGKKQLRAAEKRWQDLANEATRWDTNEGEDARADFARARAQLAWAKVKALRMANPEDGILPLRPGRLGMDLIGDEQGDPILLIRVSVL